MPQSVKREKKRTKTFLQDWMFGLSALYATSAWLSRTSSWPLTQCPGTALEGKGVNLGICFKLQDIAVFCCVFFPFQHIHDGVKQTSRRSEQSAVDLIRKTRTQISRLHLDKCTHGLDITEKLTLLCTTVLKQRQKRITEKVLHR